AWGLARAGACVGILGRRADRAEEMAAAIRAAGGEALALPADVLQRETLEAAGAAVLEHWGRIDILVNAAGGNLPAAQVDEQHPFFEVPQGAIEEVLDLNLLGTMLPAQVFAR